MGIKKKGPDGYKTRCSQVREDGGYIEAGENDNLIIQKLGSNPERFGIFGFSLNFFPAVNIKSVPDFKFALL